MTPAGNLNNVREHVHDFVLRVLASGAASLVARWLLQAEWQILALAVVCTAATSVVLRVAARRGW